MRIVDLSFPIKPHFEYLANLDQIGARRCRFMALPLKIEGADGSPVRAIALVD
jgi:kynurenine formamidase